MNLMIMFKKLFLVICLLGFYASNAQDCNALKALQSVESYMEKNAPSYQNDVIELKREKEYQQFKSKINNIASQLTAKDSFECVALVAKYFHFFRDMHLQMDQKESLTKGLDFKDSSTVFQYYSKFPTVENYTIPNKINKKSIEGYWQSENGDLAFLIVKYKTPVNEYAAIALQSDRYYWHKNQIRFEFSHLGNGKYLATRWNNARNARCFDATLSDSILTIGTHKFFRMKDANTFVDNYKPTYSSKLEFRELSALTNYIRIPDFDQTQDQVDSIVKKYKSLILSKPNLIIDIRDNLGGNDDSYYPLLDYIYDTKKIKVPYTMSFYATDENIAIFEKDIRESEEFKKDSTRFLRILSNNRENRGRFVKPSFGTLKTDTIYPFPNKIAVITNNGCASTAEGFIMMAKESPRVKIYGTNSAGCFNYGNILFSPVACLPIEIGVPSCKVFFTHPNYNNLENVGFAPDVNLSKFKAGKWVSIVQENMEKSSSK
ncbi:MAG: hypothetical protein DI598_02015 [Pseudopedobacter saltans]|uniref:Tail specific protease domain-containing protein n=1 Tax=Pseudopedobacter saltans TaxID=151895 RepID=A0A2W5F942_9SPHI|nr:MAG: hypothetical protein DI598_02015 [Pseudopedobacter saltans]